MRSDAVNVFQVGYGHDLVLGFGAVEGDVEGGDPAPSVGKAQDQADQSGAGNLLGHWPGLFIIRLDFESRSVVDARLRAYIAVGGMP